MFGSDKVKFFGSKNGLSPITKNGETSKVNISNGIGRRPSTAIYDSQRTPSRSPTNGLRLGQSPRYALSEDSTTNFPWGGMISSPSNTGGNLRLRGRAAGVKTAQTVAGPLLASTRNRIDAQMYADINSPGLTTRIVQYNDNTKTTVQSKYRGPGQLPLVNLNKNQMITISPKRPAVTVRIAPPDISSYAPDRTQFFGTSEDHRPLQPSIQDTPSAPTRSALDDLKEISRKRIHSSDEDEEFSKRPKKGFVVHGLSGPNPFSRSSISKRPREDDCSPNKNPIDIEKHPPNKRHRNMRCNDILSSLSSSKNMNDAVQPPTKRKSEQRATIERRLKRLASETVSQISISSTLVENSQIDIESEPLSASEDKTRTETNESISKSNVDVADANKSTTETYSPNKSITNPHKLTLFKKVITSEIDTDYTSLSDDDSFGEMAFVKPKKVSPVLKSEIMNKSEKSKLSQMLNCLGDKQEVNDKIVPDGLLMINQTKEFSSSSESAPVTSNTPSINFTTPQVNGTSNTSTEIKLNTSSTLSNTTPITTAIISTSVKNSVSEQGSILPSLFETNTSSKTNTEASKNVITSSASENKDVFNEGTRNTITNITSGSDTSTIKPISATPTFSFGSKNEVKSSETTTTNNIPTLSSVPNVGLNTTLTKSLTESPFNSSFTAVTSNLTPFGTSNNTTTSKLPSSVAVSSSQTSLFGNSLLSSAFSKPSEIPSFGSNTQTTPNAATSSVVTTTSAAPTSLFSFSSNKPFGTSGISSSSTNSSIPFGIKEATSKAITPSANTFSFGNAPNSVINSQVNVTVPNSTPSFSFGQTSKATDNTGNEFKFEVKKPEAVSLTQSQLSQDPKIGFGTSVSPFAFGASSNLPTMTTNSTFTISGKSTDQPLTTAANNLSQAKPSFAFGSINQTTQSNAPLFSTSNSSFVNMSKNPIVTEESKVFSFGKNTQVTSPATTAFGVSSTNVLSTFGEKSAKATSSFGTNPNGTSSGSAFGAPTITMFGSTTVNNSITPSTFGSTNVNNSTSSAFGSANINSGTPGTFGGSTTVQNSNVFGAAPTTTATTAGAFTFGGSTNTAKSSVFGASVVPSFGSSTSTFGATTSAPSFGSSSTVTPSFGSTTSGFGTSESSAFGSKSSTLPAFGSGTSSVFGAPSINSPSFGASNPVAFGANTPATTNFGAATTPNAAFGNSTTGQSSAGFGFGASATPKSNAPVFSFGGAAPNTTAPASGSFNFGSPSTNRPAVGGFNFSASTTTPNISFGSTTPAATASTGAFGSTNSGFGAVSSSFGGGEGSAQFGAQGNGFGSQPGAFNTPATGMFSIGAGGTSSRSRTPRQKRQR